MERLQMKYTPLDAALNMVWEANPKEHDYGQLIDSIRDRGFHDPPKFDPSLNEGRGGLVEGNGRVQALGMMRRAGDDMPRGVILNDEGKWAVPILYGVNFLNEIAAEAYGIDHNNMSIMAGSGVSALDASRMWDRESYMTLLNKVVGEVKTVSRDDLSLMARLASEDEEEAPPQNEHEEKESKPYLRFTFATLREKEEASALLEGVGIETGHDLLNWLRG